MQQQALRIAEMMASPSSTVSVRISQGGETVNVRYEGINVRVEGGRGGVVEDREGNGRDRYVEIVKRG
jgi:hypothetical protein